MKFLGFLLLAQPESCQQRDRGDSMTDRDVEWGAQPGAAGPGAKAGHSQSKRSRVYEAWEGNEVGSTPSRKRVAA